MAYAVTIRRHGRFKLNTSYLKSSVKCADGCRGDFLFTSVPQHIQSKAHFCDLRLYKRTFYESSKTFSIITIKNTLLVMMHLFTRVFHEPLTLNIINKKIHLCDLRLYKRTFYESSKIYSIITTKNTLMVMIQLFASVPRTSHS